MPFDPTEIRWSIACAPGPDGHWQNWSDIQIRADALRRVGLHPDQPSAIVTAPSPPPWWHHAAERRF